MNHIKNFLILGCCLLAAPVSIYSALTTQQAYKNLDNALVAYRNAPANASARSLEDAYNAFKGSTAGMKTAVDKRIAAAGIDMDDVHAAATTRAAAPSSQPSLETVDAVVADAIADVTAIATAAEADANGNAAQIAQLEAEKQRQIDAANRIQAKWRGSKKIKEAKAELEQLRAAAKAKLAAIATATPPTTQVPVVPAQPSDNDANALIKQAEALLAKNTALNNAQTFYDTYVYPYTSGWIFNGQEITLDAINKALGGIAANITTLSDTRQTPFDDIIKTRNNIDAIISANQESDEKIKELQGIRGDLERRQLQIRDLRKAFYDAQINFMSQKRKLEEKAADYAKTKQNDAKCGQILQPLIKQLDDYNVFAEALHTRVKAMLPGTILTPKNSSADLEKTLQDIAQAKKQLNAFYATRGQNAQALTLCGKTPHWERYEDTLKKAEATDVTLQTAAKTLQGQLDQAQKANDVQALTAQWQPVLNDITKENAQLKAAIDEVNKERSPGEVALDWWTGNKARVEKYEKEISPIFQAASKKREEFAQRLKALVDTKAPISNEIDTELGSFDVNLATASRLHKTMQQYADKLKAAPSVPATPTPVAPAPAQPTKIEPVTVTSVNNPVSRGTATPVNPVRTATPGMATTPVAQAPVGMPETKTFDFSGKDSSSLQTIYKTLMDGLKAAKKANTFDAYKQSSKSKATALRDAYKTVKMDEIERNGKISSLQDLFEL